MSTSSPSSSMICHQRALSLPQNSNINVITASTSKYEQTAQSSSPATAPAKSKTFAIQPVHHRTRSLPLTEETAIDFTSQSPPNFAKFAPIPTLINNNNSMESIVEDYQNMDVVNNNYRSNCGGGSSSILKHLSKIANANSGNATVAISSPSQLRKKRQHHNVMTASLRSTYLDTQYAHTRLLLPCYYHYLLLCYSLSYPLLSLSSISLCVTYIFYSTTTTTMMMMMMMSTRRENLKLI